MCAGPDVGLIIFLADCSLVTHLNYSAGQLKSIFDLLGSPGPMERGLLARADCAAHFEDWPAAPRQIDEMVSADLD